MAGRTQAVLPLGKKPLYIYQGCYADVTVYGLPAPQVAYREKCGNGYRRVLTSNWMYRLRAARRGDAGRIFQPPQQSSTNDVVMSDASRLRSPVNQPCPPLERLSVPSYGGTTPPRSQQAPFTRSTSPVQRSRSRSRSRSAEFCHTPSRSPTPQYRGHRRYRSCSSRQSSDRNVRRRRVSSSRSRSASRHRTRSPSPNRSIRSRSRSWSRSRSRSVSRTPSSPSPEGEGALVIRVHSPPRSNNPNAMAIRSRGRPPLDRQRLRELFPDVPPPAFPVLLDVDNGGQSSILVVTNLPVYFLWINVLEWLRSALPLVSRPRVDRVLRTLEDGHQVFWVKLRTITEAAALRGLFSQYCQYHV
ncbi:hypothetical protein BDN70DRAFT_940125 [Pholiota conissans]|uniref:Uncharacterized protein n=1 Tax=Pholiota conissans TaxID=109636 RepID=A0A9P5YHM7_9AGAR|nr:hypothetical protein BDN70DRAFT_940125 [Pholiota conissans]